MYIEVNEDSVALDCMILQREIRGDRLRPDWITALARAVDQVIRAQYVIQRTYLRNEIITTTVTTQGQTRRTATRWGRLPIPERFLTRKQIELDYGCDPS